MIYRWARTQAEAATLQRDGWEPRPSALTTHHGHHALLHRKADASAPVAPRLIDACPQYAAALAEFTRAAEAGDLELAAEHWARAQEAASAFRAGVAMAESKA